MQLAGEPPSDTDECIVERFLARCRNRTDFDAETVRGLLMEMYPALASRREIVTVGERKIVVKRPRRAPL
jgi:hypothetical protein